ncbi:Agamous-like MADS-box protein AGL92 [Cardamine amara subsp. amara]|uniref:Agamous-like MADS-box protein AGL92 n=1 Tax=Cardamine amara subsp. amara TaxID=228776 RepID=A0ABD1BEC2_CARAN
MPRSKVQLSLIPNETLRRVSFKRRKTGIIKKLNELTTLCDVQACAVMYSSYEPIPMVWPSNQGVQEVVSRFMELPENEQTKNMMDQTTYLQQKITKEQEKLKKLAHENREAKLRQLMFDFVGGKMNKYQNQLDDLKDLMIYTDTYIDQLHSRNEYLTSNGESSSSFPMFPAAVASAVPSAPIGFSNHIQYQNRSVNLNQHDSVQQHVPVAITNVDPPVFMDAALPTAPVGIFDHVQYYNMNMNHNLNDSVQHHGHAAVVSADPSMVSPPIGFYDHIHYQYPNRHEHAQNYVSANFNDHIQYQNMNMNQNQQDLIQYQNISMNLNPNLPSDHYPNFHSDQYPNPQSDQYSNQQQLFMDMLPGHPQQMGYGGESACIPFMDGNNYNYRLLPTIDHATTGHMPTITTTTTSAFDLYINNNI